MNTRELQCFLAVAEQLSYAGAAKTLHLSQPAVTKKIQSLENELGVKLFDRDTRHVRLTDEGRLFYPNALSLTAQAKSIRAMLRRSEERKKYHLVIGIFGLEAHLFLDEVLLSVHQRLPKLRVDIVGADFAPLKRGLDTRSIDILIGAKEVFEARQNIADTYDNLSDMPLMAVLPEGLSAELPGEIPFTSLSPDFFSSLLPGADRLTWLDFDRILPQTPEAADMLRKFSDHTVTCDNMEAALTLVRAGFGYMILPESPCLFRRKLRYLPITGAPSFHYGCFHAEGNKNPALPILLDELHGYFESGSTDKKIARMKFLKNNAQ